LTSPGSTSGESNVAVKLRLKRIGRTHRAFYRLNAVDARTPRDGRVIEELGYYDPLADNPEQQIKLDAERVQYWLSVGAQPSDTVRDLLKKSGVPVAEKHKGSRPPQPKPKKKKQEAS
jgi:ribosomal protein S16